MPIISKYYSQGQVSDQLSLTTTPPYRALRYGDGLFETLLFAHGGPVSLELHLERMWNGMSILGFEFDKSTFLAEINVGLAMLTEGLGTEHRARIRISVYRGGQGAFLPESDRPEFWIELHALKSTPAEFLENIGVATDCPLTYSKLSAVKSMNALPYILAARQAKKAGWNDAILLNHADQVVECTSSNIFFVQDERIWTPTLASACLPGTMRARIITACKDLGLPLIEKDISLTNLDSITEVFVTNAIQGIRKVKHIVGSAYSSENFPLSDQIRVHFPYFL